MRSFRRYRVRLRSLVWSLGLTAVIAPASAAQTGTGSIDGRITGSGNESVRNAIVHVLGTTLRVVTDASGHYRIRGVPSGENQLVVSYLGFRPDTVEVAVSAGGTARRDVQLTVAPLALQGIVVSGQLEGQARALNQQRSAAHIVNVIAREQIEQFPNTSVTDALRRVPGISFPGSQEINSGMHIRGLGPGFSSVRVDGERVPSTGYTGERGTNTSMLLSESIETMEVNKAITADMPADAVGGSVNIQTKRARSEDVGVSVRFTSPHTAISSRTGYEASGTVSIPFRAARLLVSGAHIKDYENEERLTTSWAERSFGGVPTVVPTRIEWADYDSENYRTFLNGVLDLELDEQNSMWLRASMHHDRKLSYSPWNSVRLDDYISADQVQDAWVQSFSRYRDWNRRLVTTSAGGRSILQFGNLTYSASLSDAGLRLPTYLQPEFQSNRFDARVDASDRRFPTFERLGGADPSDGSQYQLTRIRDFPRYSGDRDLTAGADFEVPVGLGRSSLELKAGGKFLRKRTWAELRPNRWSRNGDSDLPLSRFSHSYSNSDHFDGRNSFYPAADGEKVMAYMSQFPGMFAEETGYTASLQVQEYDATETVSAAYGMATLNIGRFSLLGGGRLEHTYFRNRGGELVYDEHGEYAGISPVYQNNAYFDIYPNAHVRYRLDDNTNLRAAFSTGLARPRLYDMTPYSVVQEDRERVSRGNPELQPSYSRNLDLLFEHYMQQIGSLSGGVFFKDVEDFIVRRTFRETQGQYAGWEVSEPQNGDGATVYGAEVSWQQRLTFLPGILSAFGIYSNYTYTRTRADLEDEREIPLPSAIPHVLNLALTFDRAGTSGSLSLNRFSDYLDGVGASADKDSFFQGRSQIDLMVRQQVGRGAGVFLELANLTNAPFTIYEGSPNFVKDQRMVGWSGRIGFNYDLR